MNISQMTLADFAKLDDIKKTVATELHLARQLNEGSWTQCGAPNTNVWYLSFTDGEIDRVELDGSELDEEFSIADCHGNADSFYYNDLTQVLYIHTTDSDDPITLVSGEPKYCIVAYFWIVVSNRPIEIEKRKQLLDDNIFNFWITSTNAEFWTEVIAGGSTVARNTAVYDDKIEVYSTKITIDAVPNAAGIYGSVTTKPGRKCKVKIKYKAPVGSGQVLIQDSASNVYLNSSGEWQAGATAAIALVNSSDWAEIEIEFVAHASYSAYRVYPRSNIANAEIYISRVEFWRYYQQLQAKCLLNMGAIPSITQGVGVYYYPENQISFGDIEINDDGYFILNRADYLWHNKEVIVRAGDLDSDYEDYPIFFYGYTRKPTWGSGAFKISVMDRRLELKRLPLGTLNTTDYPNVDDDWADRPIPILIGYGGVTTPIMPPCVDTANHKYKVTEVDFGGTTYELYSVDAVYKDGKTLATPADYTIDLPNGEFTLTADPEDSEIICEANGIESSQFGDIYTYYPADYLFFLLCIANGIDKQRLNWASFKDLYDNRKIAFRSYIDEEIDTIDLIDELQRSAVFQMFIRLDGMIEARRYSSSVPSGVPSFRNSVFVWWEIIEDTDHCYRDLVVRYEFNEISKMFEGESNEDNHAPPANVKIPYAEYEHGVKSKLTIETIHTTTFQANDLWDNYAKMVQAPMEILAGKLNVPEALLLNPTDKIKIHIEKTIDKTKHIIYNDETFQIMSITKNIDDCSAEIIAFKGVDAFFWSMS